MVSDPRDPVEDPYLDHARPDPRDHVPEELRQPVDNPIAELYDTFFNLPDPGDSEQVLLANAMNDTAALLRVMDSMPKVQDLLNRGADAIRQLVAEVERLEEGLDSE